MTERRTPSPQVGVVVPTRNAAAFLPAMLRSILTKPDVGLEVIVGDDGSSDGSADVARRFGDRRVRNPRPACESFQSFPRRQDPDKSLCGRR